MDFATLTDEDLDALRVDVLNEQDRRRIITEAPARADQLAQQYETIMEAAPATPLPSGPHRPRGRRVQPIRRVPVGDRHIRPGTVTHHRHDDHADKTLINPPAFRCARTQLGHIDPGNCEECGRPYPCPTALALDDSDDGGMGWDGTT